VEDLQDDAELMIRIIKKGGYSLHYERIETEEQMVNALVNNQWDLIISDYKLPCFSGIKALETLQKYENLDIPFILISGTIGEEIAVDSMRKGANDYLMKDNLSRLVPAIEREIKECKIRIKEKNSQKEIKRLNRFYSVLSSINEMIVRTQNKQEIFEKACKIAFEKGNFAFSWIGVLAEDNKSIKPVAFSGLDNFESLFSEVTSKGISWPETITFNALKKDKIRVINDVEKTPELNMWVGYLIKTNLKSMAIVPLIINKKIIGSFFLFSNEINFFTENEKKLLRELSKDISFAIEAIETENKRKEAELALIQSESRFKSIFNNAAAGIDLLDSDFKFVQLNNRLAEMFGYGINELIGKSILDVTFSEDFEKTITQLKRIVDTTSDSYRLEKRYKKKNGEVFWGEVSVSAIRTEKGEFVGIIGVIVDINQRKIAEENLNKINKQLENIIEFLPDATFIVDKNYKITAWNKAMEEMTGVSKKDMIGKEHIYSSVPFYGKPREQLIDILFRKNMDVVSKYDFIKTEDDKVYTEVFTPALYNNKGAYVWATASLLYDTNGNVIGAIESIRDITLRKEAELKLKESEEKFRSYVENANDIVYAATFEGVFTYVSPAWTKILGHAINEVENHSFQSFVHPEDLPTCFESLDNILKTGEKQINVEYRVLHKDGTWRWHSSNASIVYSATGKPISFVGIARDITDRKKVEKALKESEEKYRELVENANSIITKFDKDGRILSMNEFGQKLFGYKEEELIGKTLAETIVPEIDSTGKILKNLATDIFKNIDEYGTNINENIKKNGERVWIYWTNRPILDKNGEITGILSVGTNATDKIISEKQLSQNVEYFAHLVDHIRNPLAILSGFVQVKVDDEETKARVIRQVDRIEDMIKQLDQGWMDTEDTRKFLKRRE
jgi:PAS domain S-box-containing protein